MLISFPGLGDHLKSPKESQRPQPANRILKNLFNAHIKVYRFIFNKLAKNGSYFTLLWPSNLPFCILLAKFDLCQSNLGVKKDTESQILR